MTNARPHNTSALMLGATRTLEATAYSPPARRYMLADVELISTILRLDRARREDGDGRSGPREERRHDRDRRLDGVVLELHEEADHPERGGELARVEAGGADGVEDVRGGAGDDRDDQVGGPDVALEKFRDRRLAQVRILLGDRAEVHAAAQGQHLAVGELRGRDGRDEEEKAHHFVLNGCRGRSIEGTE